MRKRKGKGHNLPTPARNYSYEGRKNTKRLRKKTQISEKGPLQATQSVEAHA